MRTIYRDVDALSAAGVPIHGEPGPEGGFALLDSYRTTLTGLSAGEVRALFMLSVPAPLAELGVSEDLRAALWKLAAALPEARRGEEERVRQRFHLDSTWWHHAAEPVPHLRTLQDAVWDDHELLIAYRLATGQAVVRSVSPYGLVAKAGAWYLVCARGGRVRVHRVAHLEDARASDARFERPVGFNLADFWRTWCAQEEGRQALFPVLVRVAPGFAPALSHHLGEGVRAELATAPADQEGWVRLELAFESLEAARERILGLGPGVEVLEPEALRRSVHDFAVQTAARYGLPTGHGPPT